VVVVGGVTVATVAGWYRSTNNTNEGSPISSEHSFEVDAGDVVAGQITLELQSQGVGSPSVVLEGSQFQAKNFGPVRGA
jgi:hypothetical protein